VRLRWWAFSAILGVLAATHVSVVDVAAQWVESGATVQTYSFSDVGAAADIDQLQLLSAPLVFGWSGTSTSFAVSSGISRGIVTGSNGGFSEFVGMNDVDVRAQTTRGPFTFALLGTLPLGKARADDELLALGLMSSEVLPLAAHRWRSGGEVGGTVGFRWRSGGIDFDLSGGYLLSNGSELIEQSQAVFRPGDQARFAVTAVIPNGVAGLILLRAGYQRFATDVMDEENLFNAGARTEVSATYARPVGARESMLVSLSLYQRSAGTAGSNLEFGQESLVQRLFAAGGLLPGVAETSARLLFAGLGELRLDRGRFAFVPGGEIRVLRTADGLGAGWLASVRAAIDVHVAGGRGRGRWTLAPDFRISTGSFTASTGSRGIVGWSGGVGLRWNP